MTMRNITIIFCLLGFFACNSSLDKARLDPTTISIDDRVLYPKTNLSFLFDSLRPTTQTFTIKGDRDTLLVGQNGTSLTILKNTFVDSQLQPAQTISIDLVEVNSIADMIKANLQTTSGDKLLQTGGMFFMDAKENAKSLAIAEGKLIHIELKSYYKDPQMQIFDGKFDANGKIDWTKTGPLEKSLIPIPLSLMNFQSCAMECGFSKKQTDDLSDAKFENTYIATREFEERCCAMSYATCPQSLNLSQKFLDIYVANIDKPLFYSDSLVADYLINNFKNKIDTTKKFDFDDTGWLTYMFQSFTALKKQHLTNTINFAKLGINESTTTEDLIPKGYSQAEAENYIALFKAGKQLVKSRETEQKTSRLASYSFNIDKLGWVNVDRFMDDTNTEVSTFSVQIKSHDPLDFVSVSLVIPGYNVVVFHVHHEGNLYSFTKKDDGYRNLPVGQDAFVLAFSYKNDNPYFDKKKIKIPKDGQIDLVLTESTAQRIKQDIKKLTE
jgi:hypothetical protein